MIRLALCLLALVFAQTVPQTAYSQQSDNLYAVRGYDPKRDPGADVAAATKRAAQEGKRILVVSGGDWCV